jgi:SAM-dependent methyltransferase
MEPRDVQERITGFWSFTASGYEEHEGNVPKEGVERGAWVTAICDLLPPPPADVLDIGTGTGFVAIIASKHGHRVTGIDLSAPMLDLAGAEATGRSLDVTFVLGDAVEPAFPPASFDAIINRHFMWTLREPERAIANWLRLLKPGGRVVAIDGFWFEPELPPEPAEGEEPGLFEQYYTRDAQSQLPNMHLQSPEAVAALFRQAGFADVSTVELASLAAADGDGSAQTLYGLVATVSLQT